VSSDQLLRGMPGSIAGYLLEGYIGQGGTGAVYLARDERLGRQVAFKVVAPELAADAAFRARFLRESREATVVGHPHIIPVYQAGEADGMVYLAMRYVQDGNARSLLSRFGSLDSAQAWSIIAQVASALDAAHAHGLIHRDVKPASMLVDASGELDARTPYQAGRGDVTHVYLSDFGMSMPPPAETGATGQFTPNLDYVAPEQIRGRALDGRADLYSLACAGFELLCGTPPFAQDQGLTVMYDQLYVPPPSATVRRPDLPVAVDAVLIRALAKNPADRYATCGEFAEELQAALGLRPARSRSQRLAGSASPAGARSSVPERPTGPQQLAPVPALASRGPGVPRPHEPAPPPALSPSGSGGLRPHQPPPPPALSPSASAGLRPHQPAPPPALSPSASAGLRPHQPAPPPAPSPARTGGLPSHEPAPTPALSRSGAGVPQSPHAPPQAGPDPLSDPAHLDPPPPRRHSGRARLIVAVAAVAITAAAVAIGVLASHPSSKSTPASTTPTTPAVSATSAVPATSAVSSPAASSTPSVAASVLASRQATAVGNLLSSSATTRQALQTAVTQVQACTNLSGAVGQIQQVVNQRSGQYEQASTLSTANLASGSTVKSDLITALRDSLTADRDYLTWAQQQSAGCTPGAQSAAYTTAYNADQQANAAKAQFAQVWDPIAARYGLSQQSPESI
jgi:serine/threonine protein kinase